MMIIQPPHQQEELMLPTGYKFRPTDRELLFYFLKNKLKDPTLFQSSAAPIYDIQLYDHTPEILLGAERFGVQGHKNNVECYVFTMRHRNFLRANRANRILKDNVGYWRASYSHVDQFQERRCCGGSGGGLVGKRMNLVYYDTTTTSINTSNKMKGTKTDWLMNEYKIKPAVNNDGAGEDFVLCRIYLNNRQRNNKATGSNHQQQQEQQPQHEYMQQDQVPYLQQQEQQPAAVNDQAYNSTGAYSIDADTLWEPGTRAAADRNGHDQH